MKHSTDYHDYFIKDGRLIGKFEEMYKYSHKTPWAQDKSSYGVISDVDIAILRQNVYSEVCDIGCGLGYFTDRLYRQLRFRKKKARVTGIDISSTAVKKAARLYPKINFIKGDLIKKAPGCGAKFSLVVIKEMMWCVFHNLDRFLKNSIDMIEEGGFLYVTQSFPELKEWVGNDLIGSPQALESILQRYTIPVQCCIDWHTDKYRNGHLHYLGKKASK